MADIIIIGGGAAGCMAAYRLTQAGKKVVLLEARNRLGGRIHTLSDPAFSDTIETGAEFIHGNLKTTFRVLKEGKISSHEVRGKNWVAKEGKLYQDEDMIDNWKVLMKRIKSIPHDMPLQTFLDSYLPEKEFDELKESVRAFVEGYDAADLQKISSYAIREEWKNEDQWEQYRVDEGYVKIIDYLSSESTAAGCDIHLSSPAKNIVWEKGKVQVRTHDQVYESNQLLVTVPIGILQLTDEEEGALIFSPSLADRKKAAADIGFGSVIKILLEFEDAFWKEVEDNDGNSLKKLSYLFSKAFVPTWWTQYPDTSNVLTGWLAGPKARKLQHAGNEKIIDLAFESLQHIFSIDQAVLRKKLKASQIANWGNDPFSRGAYSYATVETAEAKKILMEPVDDTIFFAGEALYTTYEGSTVETALASAVQVVKKILR